MSTTEPTDEMVEAGTSAACELRWPDGEPMLKMRRELVRRIVTAALRAALAVAPAPSADNREAAWARHVEQIAPFKATPEEFYPEAERRGLAYRAGFDAGWAARRSPVSPPEDVTKLLAEADAAVRFLDDFDAARKAGQTYPNPEDYGIARERLIQSTISDLAAALRAPVPVETVTTVEELDALGDRAVVLDAQGVVWQRRGEFWRSGDSGRFGSKYLVRWAPFRVLFRPTREEEHPWHLTSQPTRQEGGNG